MKSAIISLGLAALFVASASAQVERASFDQSPFALGTLTEADGALPRTLWEGSRAEEVARQLSVVPVRFADPAKRLILRRVLLSPGNGPEGADAKTAGLKLLRAAEAGYVMEAGALAELTPGLTVQPELSRIVVMRDLYRGRLDQACGRGANLREGRQQAFFIRLRAFCYIHAGERPAAELTLSLAGEEGALSVEDRRMFDALLSGRPLSSFPENALHYAAYRKNAGLFAPGDIAELRPSVAAAAALDAGISVPSRERALFRAARENLLGHRELEEVAASLAGTEVAAIITSVRALPEGFAERSAAIGEALSSARSEPDLFLLLTKIFEPEIASSTPEPTTVPHAAEFALAALLTRRFETAERWMQTVAAEQSIGAERAFLNLAKLYSYLRPSAAQRLAGAIGERLPEPPGPRLQIADSLAQTSTEVELAEEVERALHASGSGSRASMLLSALTSGAIVASGERGLIRDTIGTTLYKKADAGEFVREASFKREALAFAGRLREDVVNQEAYVPRLKPSREG